MKLTLKRIASLNTATFGVLLADGVPFCLSVEPPWRDNAPRVSCIPDGRYTAQRCRTLAHYGFKDSPRFGDTFEVTGVPGRSLILFHKGNTAADTLGCIVLGEQFELLNGQPAVLASGQAFAEFKLKTASLDTFDLLITADRRG